MELLAYFLIAGVLIFPLWRICTRAGFPGALSLLALLPWIGLVIIGGILSFSTWRPKKQ